MRLTKYTLLKTVFTVGSLWFFYWGIYNELVVYHKTLNAAFMDSGRNIILMVVCLILLALTYRIESPSTVEPFQTEKKESIDASKEENPFTTQRKKVKKPKSKNTFKPYLANQLEGISDGIESVFDSMGRKKISLRWFLKLKRVYFALLFFFYFILTLTSFSEPFLALLFLSTAYLALDYLWKTRGYEWKKKEGETNEAS